MRLYRKRNLFEVDIGPAISSYSNLSFRMKAFEKASSVQLSQRDSRTLDAARKSPQACGSCQGRVDWCVESSQPVPDTLPTGRWDKVTSNVTHRQKVYQTISPVSNI